MVLLHRAHAALAYDAIQIVAEAMRRANSADAEKIREELMKADASFGVLTGALTFAKDQSAKRRVYIVQLGREGMTKLVAIH